MSTSTAPHHPKKSFIQAHDGKGAFLCYDEIMNSMKAILWMGMLLGAVQALAVPVKNNHVEAELISSVDSVRPGEPFRMALRMKMDEHWHTYWVNPGDSGLGARIDWTLPEGYSAGPLEWPFPHAIPTPPFMTYGYEDEVYLLTTITPPLAAATGGEITLSATASWLACKEVCLPGKASLSLKLPVRHTPPLPNPRSGDKIQAAVDSLPLADSGWTATARREEGAFHLLITPPPGYSGVVADAYFFPLEQGIIDHAATQVWVKTDSGYSLTLRAMTTPDAPPPQLAGVLVGALPWSPPRPNLAMLIQAPLPQDTSTTTPPPADEGSSRYAEESVTDSTWQQAAARFKVAATDVGFMKAEDFLGFLDQEKAASSGATNRLAEHGWPIMLLLIFLGGLALNLTPCVLPLIPINLAIIGAGAQAQSRGRGLALGGIYGLGMALSYGALGLVVVLTGAKFGTLNASPWFNAGIAVVFILLALAMFDIVTIDFTRFNPVAGKNLQEKRGRMGLAFGLGILAALLAGACVAPVVISVLLLAGNFYNQGLAVGLLLPFVLGLGMAAPWPIAGAGLTFLPKPGAWMTWVKYIFGVLILVMAIYYGHLAWSIFRQRAATTELTASSSTASGAAAAEARKLAAELDRAAREGKPVFIDFWATWCKNCLAMEETTFKQADVKKRLEDFVVIKFQAEDPGDPAIKEIMDHYSVLGLPTYVILTKQE